MTQAYSDPHRESDPHALPDLEVWLSTLWECDVCHLEVSEEEARRDEPCLECGREDTLVETDKCAYFYWFCSPGCLPDSDPFGPFDTEEEALEDARSW